MAKADTRHIVRIYDQKLWTRIQAHAYTERIPSSELVRRAIWAYLADPSIAAELTREHPDATYLMPRQLALRYRHMIAKMQLAQNRREHAAARKKKVSEQIEETVREQFPVDPVPDPFGLGF